MRRNFPDPHYQGIFESNSVLSSVLHCLQKQSIFTLSSKPESLSSKFSKTANLTVTFSRTFRAAVTLRFSSGSTPIPGQGAVYFLSVREDSLVLNITYRFLMN